MWLFRLALAPPPPWPGSAPGCRPTARSPPGRWRTPAPHPRKATKTARFLDLVTERHEPLASIPLNAVAGIAATLAPLADLNPGAARTALRKAVLTARTEAPMAMRLETPSRASCRNSPVLMRMLPPHTSVSMKRASGGAVWSKRISAAAPGRRSYP